MGAGRTVRAQRGSDAFVVELLKEFETARIRQRFAEPGDEHVVHLTSEGAPRVGSSWLSRLRRR
jgi:hypothetical protein